MPDALPDDVTEITDAHLRRTDLVKSPSHGMAFLIAKAEASTATMNDRPDSDFAYIEPGGHKDEGGKTTPRSKRHFPIYDAAHVRNALARAPQSPFGDKALPAIRAAAKKFGVDVSDDVSKSEADDVLDTAVANPRLGDERPTDHPGDPDDPGSPAWEAVDAANARSAVNALVALKQLVGDLACREANEAFNGDDPEDNVSAMDLNDVLCALDCALGVLAKFAVTEQAEADERAEDVLKSGVTNGLAVVGEHGPELLALPSVGDPAEIALGLVVKAGRVLSSKNEQAIRDAVASLTNVLNTLPAAKEADMTKAVEQTATEDDVAKTDAEPAEATEVAKADEDLSNLSLADLKRLAITGQDGQRQAALAELGLRTLSGGDGDSDDEDGDDNAAVEPASDEDSADPADVDPNTAGTPADTEDVTKSTDEPATDEGDPVAKAVDEAVAKAVAEMKAEYDSVIKGLRDQVTALEEQPAPARVLANGAVPPAEHLRGQADATPVPPLAQVAKLREEFASELDPAKQKEIGDRMQSIAVDALAQLHAQRR